MNALKEKILRRIAAEGPLTIAQYMTLALTEPEHGYYMKHDPFGVDGDFITAPEVSQIFGELIGLWFVQVWEDRRQPKHFHFVELGPGRGTLMADMLRAAKLRPEFLDAAQITLVETSPVLRKVQRQTLRSVSGHIECADALDTVGEDAPLFLVANEFLDALPTRQLVKAKTGWRERMVGAEDGKLVFILGNERPFDIPRRLPGAAPGATFEFSPEAQTIACETAARIMHSGGAALFIDYGHVQSGLGDTFQAVKAHKFADPLAEPGEADLTAHVDFQALTNVAKEQNVQVFGPIIQRAFLEALGIRARAARLKENADAVTCVAIDAGVERLTNPKQMGALFKAMAIGAPDTPPLPGFPC